MEFEQRKISEIIEELGLPSESILLGFIVHKESSDEFLHKWEMNENVNAMVWAKLPELAHVFKTPNEANGIANKIKNGCSMAALWDTGKAYYVDAYEAID